MNVSKRYASKSIFNNFNLKIQNNDFIGIVGKSGCGKTTLINMIGLIEPYDSGSILYDGKKITNQRIIRKLLREKISFIRQDFGLVENETVYANFKLIKKSFKSQTEWKNRVDQTLNELGLAQYGDRKVYELSGGEQQRVALAKTFFKKSEVILADEPTASLDSENKMVVLTILKKMHETGATIIMVTHDPLLLNDVTKKIEL